MSFNRVLPREAEGFVEAIIDGYEDWLSATQVIEEMVGVAEDLGTTRILIDFSGADMRIYSREARDIASFFNSFLFEPLDMALLPPADERGREILMIFAGAMVEFGHEVRMLDGREALQSWRSGRYDGLVLAC